MPREKENSATAIGEQKRRIHRTKLLSAAIEVKEIDDIEEMYWLLQTGKWAIIDACRQTPMIWIAIRFGY